MKSTDLAAIKAAKTLRHSDLSGRSQTLYWTLSLRTILTRPSLDGLFDEALFKFGNSRDPAIRWIGLVSGGEAAGNVSYDFDIEPLVKKGFLEERQHRGAKLYWTPAGVATILRLCQAKGLDMPDWYQGDEPVRGYAVSDSR